MEPQQSPTPTSPLPPPPLERFTAIGLKANVVKSTCNNPKQIKKLTEVLDMVNVHACPAEQGNLYYAVAMKLKASTNRFKPVLAGFVKSGKITLGSRMAMAVKHLQKVANIEELDVGALETACGVGITVTDDQILAAVATCIGENKEELEKQRYCYNHCKNTSESLFF